MRSYLLSILVALLPVAVLAIDRPEQSFVDRAQLYAGKDPIGYYVACATLLTSGAVPRIRFSVYMPDSGQDLGGEVDVEKTGDGAYKFDFEDGSGNRGQGSLTIKGVKATLFLKATHFEPGRGNVLRNYGTHKLTRGVCH